MNLFVRLHIKHSNRKSTYLATKSYITIAINLNHSNIEMPAFEFKQYCSWCILHIKFHLITSPMCKELMFNVGIGKQLPTAYKNDATTG